MNELIFYIIILSVNNLLFTISDSSWYDILNNECNYKDGIKYTLNDTNSACIDGSKPAFYLRKGSGDGLTKWNIFFEGGGWCYSLSTCLKRSLTKLGSSKYYSNCYKDRDMKYYQSSKRNKNPLMYNWNTVHVRYCDGSSYAGNSIQMYEGNILYFKGKYNRDNTIKTLLDLGMKYATDVIISGCSAGGLGIYLGLDHMADMIHDVNPLIKIRGLSDSGFFPNYTGTTNFIRRKNINADEAIVNGVLDYATVMTRVYSFTNMSAGAHYDCVRKHIPPDPKRPYIDSKGNYYIHDSAKCIFANSLVPHIRTPIFIIQPQYDQWQIWHVIGNPASNSLINHIGRQTVEHIYTHVLNKFQHGVFFDACTHHCTSCSSPYEDSWNGYYIKSSYNTESNYNTSMIPDLTPARAFTIWYNDIEIDIYMNNKNNRFGMTRDTDIKSRHIHMQSYLYPCLECCKCHA